MSGPVGVLPHAAVRHRRVIAINVSYFMTPTLKVPHHAEAKPLPRLEEEFS
jgi:hypothetical protein